MTLRRRSRKRGSQKRKKAFGKSRSKRIIETDKGTKLFSKEQLYRDLSTAIFNALILHIINVDEINMSIIPVIASQIVNQIIIDTTMITILDKLFGSHRNWDWYM